MANEVRSTSGLGVAAPSTFVRSTYGLGIRDKTNSVRSTYGLGQLTPSAGVRSTSGTGFVAIAAGAPLVVTGPAQSVPAGFLVQLTAIATAGGGATIAGYTWRLVTRDVGAPLPTLSATNVQNPRFGAVPSLKQYTVTFGVTATDSVGRKSAEALVVVTVHRAERVRATAGGWNRPVAIGHATALGWP